MGSVGPGHFNGMVALPRPLVDHFGFVQLPFDRLGECIAIAVADIAERWLDACSPAAGVRHWRHLAGSAVNRGGKGLGDLGIGGDTKQAMQQRCTRARRPRKTLSLKPAWSIDLFVDGQHVAGIYRRSAMLASGRYAMLDDGMGFSLVPWWVAGCRGRLGSSEDNPSADDSGSRSARSWLRCGFGRPHRLPQVFDDKCRARPERPWWWGRRWSRRRRPTHRR